MFTAALARGRNVPGTERDLCADVELSQRELQCHG